MDLANYGDVIYVARGVYKHFGIYSGEGRKERVIHYVKQEGGDVFDCCSGRVAETSLKEFLDGDSEYCVFAFEDPDVLDKLRDLFCASFNPFSRRSPADIGAEIISDAVSFLFDIEPEEEERDFYSPQETVERARSCIGQGEYDLLTQNCEHFAMWCKTGAKESAQVERLEEILQGNVVRLLG